VVLLQESKPPNNPYYLKHRVWTEIGGTRNWGSGIWSRFPISELNFENGYTGHVIAGEISLPNQMLTVVSIHSPLEHGYSIIPLHRIFSDLTRILDGKRGKRSIVLGGDFNAGVQWDEKQNGVSHRILFERVESFGLVDCTKKVYNEPVQTYRHNRGNTPWQLDYFFLSNDLEVRFHDCRVLDDDTIRGCSDHNPVLIDLDLDFGDYDKLGLLDLEENRLGVFFGDKDLLLSALTSKSYVKEGLERNNDRKLMDNERLAFLGDAVLELVIREYLHSTMSDDKSILSQEADKIVDNATLHDRAAHLGLRKFLRLGIGESKDDDGELKILSNAFEAIIGAIYIDKDFTTARDFIMKKILSNN